MSTFARYRRPLIAFALLTLAPFAGCASQAEIDRLNEANRALMDDNARLARERDEARTGIDSLRDGTIGKEKSVAELQRQLQDAMRQRDDAIAQLHNLGKRLGELQIGPVDAETDRALAELARRYPDLITYDPQSGMLRVSSDLTFDSGKADVKPAARPALQALAQILTSGAAQQYDVIVEGHTDSQRISANTAREHRTNRHLSVHRAISVIDELRGMGVAPEKLMAAGWGEFRPAVPNSGSGNTPQNRRVELFLVKSRGTFTSAQPEAAPAPAHTEPEITK